MTTDPPVLARRLGDALPVDVALAGVTAVGVLAGTALLGGRLDQAGVVPLALQLGLVLFLRGRWPVVTLLLSVQAVIVFRSAGLTDVGWVWPATVAYVALAVDDRPGRPGLPWAIGIGAVELGFAASWEFAAGEDARTVLGTVGAETLWLAAVLAAAAAARNARRWRAELAASMRRAEREREREAGRRITEARLQIARELHDVVAHTLTVVGVQLRVAGEALEDSTEEARDALTIAQQVRTQAVQDLRSLVELLRDPSEGTEDADSGLAPRTGLDGLPDLLERTRASGLEIRLETTGDIRSLPAPVELAAYRVVQESLTNTVRHARARRATVTLRRTDGQLTVEVVDDGPGGPAESMPTATHTATPGHGITGMRERIHALGGSLTAGPEEEQGGYAVRATLPVPVFPS
ncbi:sensor histidine kinase [Streptomyces sp. NPDC048604]|uniref:sensor histidine kinase n=1 Tax=Streptomyces sp. NPDC048604 TaxID=3365578 RepID=UPI00371F9AA2